MDQLQQSDDLDVDLSFLETPLDTQALIEGPSDFTTIPELDNILASDYAEFEKWIPDFQRPAKPCDYCSAKGLACYFRRGAVDCYACLSLFRECSLGSTSLEATNFARNVNGNLFDALHSVTEDVSIEQGSRTTMRYLVSKDERSRNGTRFPQAAVKILRDWYSAHQDHPYPNEQEKATLEANTGLKSSQITNWLANQRRKTKALTMKRHRRCSSPSAVRPATPAIDIISKPWEEQNPLERWQNSPPENEPAAMDDIVDAIESCDLPDGASTPSSLEAPLRSSNASRRRGAGSSTSAEDSQTCSLSAPSSAAHSGSTGSFNSFSSSLVGKRDRRRRNKRTIPLRQIDNEKRIFQCSFCTDRFKSKWEWRRHETSLHLSLEKWICAPLGAYVMDKDGHKTCVFCGEQDPADDHAEQHGHHACEEKGLDSRTFYRKDHLRQHLRLVHGCQLTPSMEAWKATTPNVNSRCGFCAQRLTTWDDRVNHLAAHFRAGARMIDWKGCRGLDPAVASQVTNAMPPYLIGIESLSPNPFSATNEASMREWENNGELENGECDAKHSTDDLPPKATCWEILTIRLGKFVNEMVGKNITVTDEMLQRQARLILYGDDDQWHQTAADNETWLSLFKKGHGLSYIPGRIGASGEAVPEDIEWYSDLGVRVPFFVQLEQYNKAQNEEALQRGTGGRAREDSETSMMMLKIYTQLLSEGVLHSIHVLCPHQSCANNLVEAHYMTADGSLRRRQHRYCNDTITGENAQLLAKFISLARSGVSIAPVDQLQVADGSPRRAAKARAACLETLQWGEVTCCPFREQIKVTGDRRDEHTARVAALRKSAAPYETAADGSLYFPYHAAEMPEERLKTFSTNRQASEDSGTLGAVISPQQPQQSGIDMEMLEMVNRISPVEDMDQVDLMPSEYSVLATDEHQGQISPFNTYSTLIMPEESQLPLQSTFDILTSSARERTEMTLLDSNDMPGTTEQNQASATMQDLQFDAIFDMSLDDDL